MSFGFRHAWPTAAPVRGPAACALPTTRREWLARACRVAMGGALGAATAGPATGEAALWRPPPLLLARIDGPHIDPGRYLASEKLDGVRAYWDGQRLQFRSGRPVAAPAWFVDALPAQALDGELWIGRRRFDELSGLVRREVPDVDAWRSVTYQLFELPGAPGRFIDRVAAIERLVARLRAGRPDSPLRAIEHRRVADRTALDQLLARTLAAGGEGLMLHRADAPYVTGRSDVLVKLKAQLDAEAVVVAHVPGRGRLDGLMGALELRTPEGRRFHLGTGFSDAQRRHPPPVGTTITYRYRDLTPGGLPRFASFLRIRDEP